MKKFDQEYRLLEAMYEDTYFPDFLTDKVRNYIMDVIRFLETGEKDLVRGRRRRGADAYGGYGGPWSMPPG